MLHLRASQILFWHLSGPIIMCPGSPLVRCASLGKQPSVTGVLSLSASDDGPVESTPKRRPHQRDRATEDNTNIVTWVVFEFKYRRDTPTHIQRDCTPLAYAHAHVGWNPSLWETGYPDQVLWHVTVTRGGFVLLHRWLACATLISLRERLTLGVKVRFSNDI